MTELQPTASHASRWWRWSDYQLVDDHIVPAEGAVLEEYDPWAEYVRSRERGASNAPPYQSLLALADKVRVELRPSGPCWESIRQPVLEVKGKEALLRWCRDYGLLGILPQEFSVLTLPPSIRVHTSEVRPMPNSIVHVALVRHTAVPGGWATATKSWMSGFGRDAHALEKIQSCVGQPDEERGGSVFETVIDWDEVGEVWAPHYDEERLPVPELDSSDAPGAIGRTGQANDGLHSLDSMLNRFFVRLSESEARDYRIPRPLSLEFWPVYSEQVTEFILIVHAFRKALSSLADESYALTAEAELVSRQSALGSFFDRLTSSVGLVLAADSDGGFRETLVCPSLLASFAVMMLKDVAEGRGAKTCTVCGGLFLSSSYQATYCSDRCRNTAQKRRYRSAKKGEVK